MNSPVLLIRADADVRMGTGHFMRCMALAQAWQDRGGKAVFAMADGGEALTPFLSSEGMKRERIEARAGTLGDARETSRLAAILGADRVAVDGYHFGTEYQKELVDRNLKVFWIDDCGHAAYYSAHWVLNQNIHAHENLYRDRDRHVKLLLSPRFALLRKEFSPWIGWEREIVEKPTRILVTLGGSDPDNMTLKVIEAVDLLGDPGLEVLVIAGAANPHFALLETICGESKTPIRLRRSVDDMPERMAWADLAVTAGGSTCWETAFMGLPSVVLILAENQQMIAERLHDLGAVRNVGSHAAIQTIAFTIEALLEDSSARAGMSRAGRHTVDGRGAQRVAKILAEEPHEDPVLRQ